MRRLGYCLLLTAACSGGKTAGTPCSIDQSVEVDAPAAAVDDCGTFDRGALNYTDEALSAAQLCVLNDITNKRSFRLIYDAVAVSGTTVVRAAFTGVAQSGALRLRTYAGQGGADMSTSGSLVSERDCAALLASSGCKPSAGIPCLDCTGAAMGVVLCRE